MTRKRLSLIASAFICFLTMVPGFAQEEPPSFLNLVAVGDSLTAGFVSGSLVASGQQNSFPAVIARQVGTFHFLPLITEPGIPNELILLDPGPPPIIVEKEGSGATRRFPLIVPQNLAVPGQDIGDALSVKPALPLDTLEDIVLGVPILVVPLGVPPLSQIELAFALEPTFTLFWLGSNDVLGSVLSGGEVPPTSLAAFQQAYTTAVGTILASGSNLIVANIPDVTVLPFLTSLSEIAAIAGVPPGVLGPLLGIQEGDLVTAPGLAVILSILAGESQGPLPPEVVLTVEEAAEIESTVDEINAFIEGLATVLGFPVVDINARFDEVRANGLEVAGVPLTTDFLGGIFSLDGIHPTFTGQAVLANAFIDKINETWGLSIPAVNLAEVAAGDPLFPPNLLFSGIVGSGTSVLSLKPEYFEGMVQVFLSPAPRPAFDTETGPDPTIEDLRRPLSELLEEMDEWIRELPAARLQPGPVVRPDRKGLGSENRLREPRRPLP